jgi:8-oxo-dGTP pyrophosphatase MutT (NUDIX family)
MMATYARPVNVAVADRRRALTMAALDARRSAGPVDRREAASLARFADELSRLARPFDEDAGPVHVTASAIIVGPSGVILHLHKRLGIWLQPGGHLAPGEESLAAALREAREETGLSVTATSAEVIHVDVHGGGRGHVHLDLRHLLAADGPPDPPADESQRVQWFAWPDAIARAEDGLRGILMTIAP